MGAFAGQSEIVSALVRRITVAQEKVTIEVDPNVLAERLAGSRRPKPAGGPSCDLDQGAGKVSAARRRSQFVVQDQDTLSVPDAKLVRASRAPMIGSVGSFVVRQTE